MYLPEDGIDESIVAVHVEYEGSSKDHYYRLLGVTEEAAQLARHNRACGCQLCLKLMPLGCKLMPTNTDLLAGTTPRSTPMNIQYA